MARYRSIATQAGIAEGEVLTGEELKLMSDRQLAERGRSVAVFALTMASACAETVRVGKAGRDAFSFVPADVGQRTGIFNKHGLDLETSSFGGDARVQQAMAADGIDIGLGSGPGLAFVVKGSPVKGIAAFADPLQRVVRVVALHTLACDRCKQGECRPPEAAVLPEALRQLRDDGDRHVRAMAVEVVGQFVHTNANRLSQFLVERGAFTHG